MDKILTHVSWPYRRRISFLWQTLGHFASTQRRFIQAVLLAMLNGRHSLNPREDPEPVVRL